MKVPLPVRVVPSITFQAWLTPPPVADSTIERDREALRSMSHCHFGGLSAHELGTGPLAIAMHGWGGRPGQMVSVAHRLADEGFHAIIPELPGHAGGPKTDIKQAAASLRSLTEEIGEPEVIVAHSFAAMVLRLAYPKAGPPNVVLVAPALDVRDALDVFSDRLRLMPWARRGLKRRLQAWDPNLWPTVSQILPQQLEGAAMMIVHDPNDRETSFSGSAELAALRPATSVVALEGAGHSRILSNPVVLDAIADFLAEEVAADSAA